MKTLSELTPSFQLGNEDSWLLEQKYLIDGKRVDDSDIERSRHELETSAPPNVVFKQRTGWYLTPHPIHSAVRKFISKAVVVLLFALAYLFVEPLLRSLGIPGIGTCTIRIGLLDYPLLAVIIVPLVLTPLALRAGANFADLVHQRKFLLTAPSDPIVTMKQTPTAGRPLHLEVNFPEKGDDWGEILVTWRVGALPPAREVVFKSLGAEVSKQPPPGLTTELPHHWEIGLDDGTGGGEEAPMERQEVRGGLFLRPMRSMQFGGRSAVDSREMILEPPQLSWPGTVSSELIRIHWELIIRIERKKGGPLLWVLPLEVGHPLECSRIGMLPTNDGRAESNTF